MTLPETGLLEKADQSQHVGIKQTFTKKLPLSVFELLTYQNAKSHAKHSLWRKIILLKTFFLCVFDHIIYKNA